ncbi:autoinducer 2 ABC transporter permease LsrC [Shigella sonnei]|nr:autoinducer 2 ABC transporter permease LsrC [Shigella sonnei]CSF82224.1 autoinducer 2 ABC transporter permease LsrC [Shigella sonnei]
MLKFIQNNREITALLAVGATLVMLMRKVVSAMISWIILSRARQKYGAASVVVDEQSWLSSGVKKSPY